MRSLTVRLVAPHLVDRENSNTVLSHLPFANDKEQARGILDAH